MEDLFIVAGQNLTKESPKLIHYATFPKEKLKTRWETDEGKKLFDILKQHAFSREIIEENVGRYYDHYDLRGISLSGEDLQGRNLSSVDFFSANLERANLTNCNLANSWLSETNLKGATFNWAEMENVHLDNVDYDVNTHFYGVDLGKINFTLAALLRDLAVSQQRIAHLEKRSPFLAYLLKLTSDYGRSLTRWMLWCLAVIVVFGLLFGLIPLIDKAGILNGLYYSVVTFTTLGYGDIKPTDGWGQVLSVTEVCLGYLMGGLLVAILTKKVIGNS